MHLIDNSQEAAQTEGEPCPECGGYGYVDGCGHCDTPCTTEGMVVCKRTCEVCNDER